MDDASVTISDIFVLALILVIVVYFVGFVSDVNAVSQAGTSLINAATGRNPSGGAFQNYPGGASLPTAGGNTITPL